LKEVGHFVVKSRLMGVQILSRSPYREGETGMKPWERVATLAGEMLYVWGMVLLIAGVSFLAIMGWTAAREFLGKLLDKPGRRAITT
jgi:hypothetical protein